MRVKGRTLLLAALAAVLAACAGGTQQASTDPNVTVRRADRNVITADEIEQSGALTARQAIERLRPHMLSARPVGSIQQQNTDEIQVYVDNQRFGGLDQLNSIQAHEIEQIRHLTGTDATTRFGTGHTLGAILITRKKR